MQCPAYPPNFDGWSERLGTTPRPEKPPTTCVQHEASTLKSAVKGQQEIPEISSSAAFWLDLADLAVVQRYTGKTAGIPSSHVASPLETGRCLRRRPRAFTRHLYLNLLQPLKAAVPEFSDATPAAPLLINLPCFDNLSAALH